MLSPESYQLVIEKFMKSLRDGTLKQGDKIYSEHQLARILGIPRAQVREVYAALSVLGILYGQQGKGTFLSPADMSQHSKILYLMTLTAGENFQDVVTVRRILETGGAALAAANRTEEDLSELFCCAETIEHSQDPQTLTDADTAFHGILLRASGNALLHSLFQIVVGYMARISLQHWRDVIETENESRRRDYIAQHWAIAHAARDRDGVRLQALLETHFETLRRDYGIS